MMTRKKQGGDSLFFCILPYNHYNQLYLYIAALIMSNNTNTTAQE